MRSSCSAYPTALAAEQLKLCNIAYKLCFLSSCSHSSTEHDEGMWGLLRPFWL